MGASDFAKLPHIGESYLRKEDYRFLTGAGQYTDDIDLVKTWSTQKSTACPAVG